MRAATRLHYRTQTPTQQLASAYKLLAIFAPARNDGAGRFPVLPTCSPKRSGCIEEVQRNQMRCMGPKFLLAAILLAAIPSAAFAHHGTSHYDLGKTITLMGTVTGFDWGNPHCLVYIDVKADNDKVQHWTLELASPYTMSRAGWTRNSLMVGDMILAQTHPARNGITLGISATSRSIMKFVINGKPLRM